MQNWLGRIRTIHLFLAKEAFYALLLASGLACGILAVRIYLSQTWRYYLLGWNLFLAWVPYWCSLGVIVIYYRYKGSQWRLLFLAALWLLFFPNAPYIVTDLVYLRQDQSFPLWYDIGLLTTFAWTGCFLGITSLHMMQRIVRSLTGAVASWLFVIGTLGLSGLGIYLGRFMRWNSWDLLHNPRHILADVINPLVNPHGHLQAVGVTIMFAAFLFVCYLTFTTWGAQPLLTKDPSPDNKPTNAFDKWRELELSEPLTSPPASPNTSPRQANSEDEWVLTEWSP